MLNSALRSADDDPVVSDYCLALLEKSNKKEHTMVMQFMSGDPHVGGSEDCLLFSETTIASFSYLNACIFFCSYVDDKHFLIIGITFVLF